MLSDTKLRSIYNKNTEQSYELSDRDALSIRVSKNGKVVFQYRFRFKGKACRLSLGSYPSLTLSNARLMIPDIINLLEKGIDPRVHKKNKHEDNNLKKATLDDCVDLFLEKYTTKLRSSTQLVYKYSLNKHCRSYFSIPVEDITRKQWYEFFDQVISKTTENTANGLIKQIKTCLKFCQQRELIDHLLDVNYLGRLASIKLAAFVV
jgi:hypothetical protein